jgi:hypothetical protein
MSEFAFSKTQGLHHMAFEMELFLLLPYSFIGDSRGKVSFGIW